MKKIIISILGRIKRKLYISSELNKITSRIEKCKGREIAFLFQTPTHSNIGDHAITIAELEFFEKNFPDIVVIEINQTLMTLFINRYSGLIKDKDLIVLNGGGNFGNEYMFEENLRRLVIERYPNNKIIVFPQTIHYSDDEVGKRELNVTQAILDEHENVIITTREEVSFELAKKYFPNNEVILTPDIVLSMSKNYNKERLYALAVIRNDQESILSESMKSIIDKALKHQYDDVVYSDMHVEGNRSVLTSLERKVIVDNKLKQFAGAKIVVTDRLHGMVLAAITGTPCIAFSNYNQKVSGTYNWIKGLDYIKYVENEEEFMAAFEDLIDKDNSYSFNSNKLREYFNPLINVIQNE